MDPELRDDESPFAGSPPAIMDPGTCSESPSCATSQGGHGDGGKSDPVNKKMEQEVEDLLVILRDMATEIDDKIARIEVMRGAAISKPRGSMVWRYLIKPVVTGFGRALFHTATAFIGSFLTFLFIFAR